MYLVLVNISAKIRMLFLSSNTQMGIIWQMTSVVDCKITSFGHFMQKIRKIFEFISHFANH